jgi:hypothetical protein
MVSSITGAQSSNILAGLSAPQTTPSGSMASFTEQLAAALEGYLAQSSNNSNLEIDIQSTQSQNSGVRQFIVTVKNPDSATAQADSAPSNAGPVSTPAASVQTPSAQASAVQNTPTDQAQANLIQAQTNAYWAAQPPAVQQLRNLETPGERSILAQQLADQGYTIDVPIMVWGWSPMNTMLTRQIYGYTWVPGMNQAAASTPGLTVGNQVAYDPKNPPPGSIAVNTDFAKGLGLTDPQV